MAEPASVRAQLSLPAWSVRPATALVPLPTQSELEAASFEVHPDAQFVVSAEGEIVASNRAARELVDRGRGARALAESWLAGARELLCELRERVATAIRTQCAAPELTLALRDGFDCRVDVIPLGPERPHALVIVRRRESRALRSARERFGFTRAEQQVADRLARGLTVPLIARQLEISAETVRCHLKQAFIKAGVHRQAELVAALLND
jgi:DNA-binding CsgD family transcriptional regulator